jgi:DNA-binding transcriptional ArsR family regulator
MVQYSQTVDRTFAALADPTRRAVVERLWNGTATVSELAKPFGITLTGMKKHIHVLEEAGLVTTTKVGRTRRCALAPQPLVGVQAWLRRLDRFADVLERTKGER